MTDLRVGDPAPDFSLRTQDGGTASLHDFRGKRVVLYFYPKDDTPGCTTEACEFRDTVAPLRAAGAAVVGISPDNATSHEKFARKYDLTFPLLADDDTTVAQRYGVWQEKSMYGRTYMGVDRSTFLIGPDGTIEEIWRKVKPQGHAAEVLAALQR